MSEQQILSELSVDNIRKHALYSRHLAVPAGGLAQCRAHGRVSSSRRPSIGQFWPILSATALRRRPKANGTGLLRSATLLSLVWGYRPSGPRVGLRQRSCRRRQSLVSFPREAEHSAAHLRLVGVTSGIETIPGPILSNPPLTKSTGTGWPTTSTFTQPICGSCAWPRRYLLNSSASLSSSRHVSGSPMSSGRIAQRSAPAGGSMKSTPDTTIA